MIKGTLIAESMRAGTELSGVRLVTRKITRVAAGGMVLDPEVVRQLLRASRRLILICLAVIVPLAAITGLVVAHYAGLSVPTKPFGPAFNFATPAVLTQDWTHANVILATGVALVLLAACVAIVTLLPRQRARPAA